MDHDIRLTRVDYRWAARLLYADRRCSMTVVHSESGLRAWLSFFAWTDTYRRAITKQDVDTVGDATVVVGAVSALIRYCVLYPQSNGVPVWRQDTDLIGPRTPKCWPDVCRLAMTTARAREPWPLLDYLQQFAPEPWSYLGHDPAAFFRAVCPYPLLEFNR